MTSDDIDIETVPIDSIIVEERQRSELEDVSELAGSISIVDILQPPVVQRHTRVLVIGATRLAALKSLGHTAIRVLWTDETDPLKIQLMELHENVYRSPLKWEDEFRGIVKIYRITRMYNPEFSYADLAKFVRKDPGYITKIFDTVEQWEAGNPLVRGAAKKSTAIKIVENIKARQAEDDRYESMLAKGLIPERSPNPILNLDFNEWARAYEGQLKFNFVHCDFPFGIKSDSFNQGAAGTHGGFEDDPETYWTLCKSLRDNLSRFTEPSCHFMFWFSMHYYHDTLEFFKGHIDFDPFPLIWHKTDGAGIAPDWQRVPRRVYDTAFFGSRGDRKILTVKANAFGWSSESNDRDHTSAKPVTMLKHFFDMFVDSSTRMLDPTAGSGSSLKAAESLGARYVLGLEYNEKFCENANRALRKQA
jgi:hypothetical protein